MQVAEVAPVMEELLRVRAVQVVAVLEKMVTVMELLELRIQAVVAAGVELLPEILAE
jgi:hypothetical protein